MGFLNSISAFFKKAAAEEEEAALNALFIKQPWQPVVYVGGAASSLRVVDVTWRSGANPNEATLEAVGRFELAFRYAAGTPVKIVLEAPGSGRDAPQTVLFVGRISGHGGDYSPTDESARIYCLGPRWDLAKDFIKGSEVMMFDPAAGQSSADARPFCADSIPCVFNAGGRKNKLTASWVDDDGPEAGIAHMEDVFHADARVLQSASEFGFWSVWDALHYIYRQRTYERRREGRSSFASTQLDNVVGDPLGGYATLTATNADLLQGTTIYDLGVDGKTLLDAMGLALETGGFHWWVKPLSLDGPNGGPVGELRATLKAFLPIDPDTKRSPSVAKTLYLPKIGVGNEALGPSAPIPGAVVGPRYEDEASRLEHNRGSWRKDFSGVRDRVQAYGRPVTVELTFDLRPGWNRADLLELLNELAGDTSVEPHVPPNPQAMRIHTTEQHSDSFNPEQTPADEPRKPFFRDLGRLFILNETGYENDRTEERPYDWKDPSLEVDDVFDAIKGDGVPVAMRPRPLLNRLLSRPRLQSSGAGASIGDRVVPQQLQLWHPAEAAWVAAPAGSWELLPDRAGVRITTARIDQRPFWDDVTATFATKARITAAVEMDWLFTVAGEAESEIEGRVPLMVDQEVPETDFVGTYDEMARLAQQHAEILAQALGNASYSIPWVTPAYEPGDWITEILGRAIPWRGQVVEVRLDWHGQETHIQLEDAALVWLDASGGAP